MDFGAKGDTKLLTLSVTASSPSVTSVFAARTGTISSLGTVVSGVSTKFREELQIGEYIYAGGEHRKVVGVIDDTQLLIDSAFSSTISGASFSSGVGFSTSDIGKRIIIFGAGGPSSRETYLSSAVAGQGTTNSWVEAARIDAQGATKISFGFNCALAGAEWEVFGSNAEDFSGESTVHSAESATALDYSLTFNDATPDYRYYRVKVKSTATDTPGTAYVTISAWGRVHGATISGIVDTATATLDVAPLTTRSSASGYFGTDDTESINAALQAGASFVYPGTSDGGITLDAPRGIYLFSDQIFHRHCVTLRGHGGGGTIFLADAAAFPGNTAMWNMTGTFQSDGRIAFFTRLEDVRVDCSHVPGSVGVYCDALQENSGLKRVTSIQWCSRGIQASSDTDRYGCVNWTLEDCYAYPSPTVFGDDDATGLELYYALYTTIIRGTFMGQGGYLCGYGRSIHARFGLVTCSGQIHMESARIGLHLDTGSGGIVGSISAQSFVSTALAIEGGNPTIAQSVQTSGRYSISHPIRNFLSSNQFEPLYIATTESQPMQLGGPMQMLADPSNPNTTTWDCLNFSGPDQGGWVSINSRADGYPKWVKTSNSSSDDAMFFKRSAQGIEIRVGNANQPVYVAQGKCSVTGTAVSRVSGDAFNTLWEAGSQIVLAGGVVGTIASVSSSSDLTLTFSVGTMSNVSFGVSTDPDAFGGAEPGKLWLKVQKDEGTWTPRLNFDVDSLGPMDFGNKLGLGRFRWTHGDTDQENLHLQASFDSGATWSDVTRFSSITGGVRIAGLTFDAVEPLGFGSQVTNRFQWTKAGSSGEILRLQGSNDGGGTWGNLLDIGLSGSYVLAKRLLFDAAGQELNFGNDYGSYRARWIHGESSQELLALESSDDSGGSWKKLLNVFLSGQIAINGRQAVGPGVDSLGATETLYVMDTETGGVTEAVFRSGLGQGTTPETPIIQLKNHAGATTLSLYGSGAAEPSRLGVGGSAPINDGWAYVATFLGISTSTRSGDVEVFRVNGGALLDGFVKVSGLTASRPVVTDSNKKLISSKIDISNDNFVQGSGLSSGNILSWDGTKVTGVNGLSSGAVTEITSGPTADTVTYVTGLSGTIPSGLTVTTETKTFLTGFGVATHSVSNGIITSWRLGREHKESNW
jgi:hypothetical protein